jgi:hypothetical protein
MTPDQLVAHELGHAMSEFEGFKDINPGNYSSRKTASDAKAVYFENVMRGDCPFRPKH